MLTTDNVCSYSVRCTQWCDRLSQQQLGFLLFNTSAWRTICRRRQYSNMPTITVVQC